MAHQSIKGTKPTTLNIVDLNKPTGNLKVENNFQIKSQFEMNNGDVFIDSNYILELGQNVSNPGVLDYKQGFVEGTMKRWFKPEVNTGRTTGFFPIAYMQLPRFTTVEYTNAPISGGSLTVSWVEEMMGEAGLPIAVDGTDDCIPFSAINTSKDGYWKIDDNDGLNGGRYDITLQGSGLTGITDICQLTALKRVNGGDWIASGDQVTPMGDIFNPVVKRTGASGWSNWGFGGGEANPLPVELISFTAQCDESKLLIEWTTATELNSYQFQIEKSRNGTDWETIHTEAGAGNSSTEINYQFIDNMPRKGISYYRLRQEDFNGDYEYFGPISVECKIEMKKMIVFPNPSQNYFTVELISDVFSPQSMIQVYDQFGRMVEARSIDVVVGTNQFVFHNSLPSGSYIVRLLSNDFSVRPFNIIIKK